MKQQNLRLSSLLLAALLATSCSNENDPVAPINPADNPEAVELGVTAGVSLTKSAITGGDANQSETDPDVMQSIAVFAVGSGTSYSGGNNKAVYKLSDGEWDNSETDRSKIIFLTNEVATIYAVHPEYDPSQVANTEWKITPAADATIGISVFADASENVSEDNDNTIPTTGSGILSAPGEIDYMYAVDGKGNGTDQPTASNGRTASSSKTDKAWEVSLKMKHALAMVSFRIYNDGTYAGPGKLTKIVLKNSSGTALSKGTNPTMAINNGAIVPGDAVAATYTRFIGDNNGYVLKKQGSSGLETTDAAKNASSKFSILVLPHNGAKNTMKVEFTIDGAVYDVPLASEGNSVNWSAGSNNLYTAKLSGKELTLSSVTVEAWGEGTDSGELPIN